MARRTINRPSQSTADKIHAQTQCEERQCIRACFFGCRSELASACCRCSAGDSDVRPSRPDITSCPPPAATGQPPTMPPYRPAPAAAAAAHPIRARSAQRDRYGAPAPYRRTNPAPGVPGPALRGRFKPTVAPRQSASLGRPRHPPREGREDAEGGFKGGAKRAGRGTADYI